LLTLKSTLMRVLLRPPLLTVMQVPVVQPGVESAERTCWLG